MWQCGHAYHRQCLALGVALCGHRCNIGGPCRAAAFCAATVNTANPRGLHLIVKVLLNRVLQLVKIALGGAGTLQTPFVVLVNSHY